MGSSEVLLFDLEADGLLHEATKIHCIALASPGEEPVLYVGRDVQKALHRLFHAKLVVAHNGVGYDRPLIEKLHPGWKCPELRDTMLMAMLRFPHMFQVDWGNPNCKVDTKLRGRQSLKAWGQRLGLHKGDYDGGWESYNDEMGEYCVQDVRVLDKLLAFLRDRSDWTDADDLEHQFADCTAAMQRKGVGFDVEAAEKLALRLRAKVLPLEQELHESFPPYPAECLGVYGNQRARAERIISNDLELEVFEGWEQDVSLRQTLELEGIKFRWKKEKPFNPNSRQQIEDRLRRLGWKPTEFTDKGHAKLDEPQILAVGRKFKAARPLADYMLIQKRLGQLVDGDQAWLKLVRNGRIHGRVNTMGTVTFRCSHSNPNLGQVPNMGAPYGPDCRSLFVPSAGRVLVGCDASGLELRVLGHYLASLDGGSFARECVEGDIHTRNQEAAGLPTRDKAKTFIYAFLYGAGDSLLGALVNGGSKEGKKLRAKFLRNMPALKLFLERVRVKAQRTKQLKALDGRTLYVRSVHSAPNMLIQSAGAIVCKRAKVIFRWLMEKAGHPMGSTWDFVLNVHDEFQVECEPHLVQLLKDSAERSFRLAGLHYNMRVQLDGEAKHGASWAETH